jgi:hypothetical protein
MTNSIEQPFVGSADNCTFVLAEGFDISALAAWRAAKRWRSHERSETRKGATPLGVTPKLSFF